MFRSLIAEPAELQRLADAFDAAWIVINAHRRLDLQAASMERERLSCILMRLWETDPHQDLATEAAQRFIENPGHAVRLADDEPTAM